MSSIGMALVTKCVTSNSQRRAVLAVNIAAKRRFINPSILERRNALVLKVGVSYEW